MIDLRHGDCIEIMRTIPDGSIDCVLTDPPYGTTECVWDSAIPFDLMWEQLKRITKPTAVVVLTASQPFTSTLVMSNIEQFRYCWVWEKALMTGFHFAKNRPLKAHEDIVVFSAGGTAHNAKIQSQYNPQMTAADRFRKKDTTGRKLQSKFKPNRAAARVAMAPDYDGSKRYPRSIQRFSNADHTGRIHPTQKPVALMAYLVRTYTQKGETVLDFTMGSGTTGVACVQEGRAFIGIERDDAYFKAAQERITDAARQGSMF